MEWLKNSTNTVPFWSLFQRIKRTGFGNEELLSVYRDYGVIRKNDRDDNNNRPGSNLNDYQLVERDDLVLNKMKTWQGSLGVSTYRGIVSPAYFVYKPLTDNDNRYLNYVLRSQVHTEFYAAFSKGIRVNQWDLQPEYLNQMPVFVPSLDTQRRIAAYLDAETAQIDAMMAKLDEQVVLLRERKIGLLNDVFSISDTTSRTVNTFSWFGSLPSGWKTTRVGLVGKPVKIKNSGMLEDNLLSLSYGRIVRRDIRNKEGLVPESYETYQIVSPGDVVMRFTDLQNDQKSLRSGLVMEKGILTSAYLTIRPNPELIDSTFFAAVMRLVDLRKIFYRMGSGVRQSLNYDEFSSLEIPLPPLDEQRRIVAELDEKTARMDTMITKCEELKTLLQERRAALITAVVTGQKEVPSHD